MTAQDVNSLCRCRLCRNCRRCCSTPQALHPRASARWCPLQYPHLPPLYSSRSSSSPHYRGCVATLFHGNWLSSSRSSSTRNIKHMTGTAASSSSSSSLYNPHPSNPFNTPVPLFIHSQPCEPPPRSTHLYI